MILNLLNNICPGWVEEYKFHPTRKWRADFANPKHKILIEIHGSVHAQGRHTRGTGFIKDREKINTANILGYYMLEYCIDKHDNYIAAMLNDVELLVNHDKGV